MLMFLFDPIRVNCKMFFLPNKAKSLSADMYTMKVQLFLGFVTCADS